MKVVGIIISFFVFLKHFFCLLFFPKRTIDKIQYKKLRNVIRYAWDNIPAYRKLWESNNFKPEMFNCIADINKIPIINKDFVRNNYEAMVSVTYQKDRLTLVTTGGTTGMPMRFYIDLYKARAKEMAYKAVQFYRYWKILLFIDRVVVLKGRRLPEELLQKNIFWENIPYDNGIYLSSFHICEDNYLIYLNQLRKFKPKYIKAYPSSIVAFCLLMKRHSDYGIPGLKGIICSSENISEWHRQVVNETLGVKIFSYYGHSEKAVSAYENSHGLMEFQPLYSFVEFYDVPSNYNSNVNSLAKVVVTSFDNTYFPFIRYDTDDYIEPAVSNNVGGKFASKILGREQEFVIAHNGDRQIFTCQDEAIWGIEGIVNYQYIQNYKGKLDLNLQVDDSFDRQSSIPVIQSRLNDIFVNIEVTIRLVNQIDKTKAGKSRYFISNISK